MGCNQYPHMFAPMTIKGVTFKNRVLASPITTNRIVDHGYPTPRRASTSMRPGPGRLRGSHRHRELHRPRVRMAP